MAIKRNKIVDVSGYGHSGKTAISDFIKDFECVSSFPNNVEFELFRVKGGLLDLYFSCYLNWNLIRSRASILEYQKLVKRIGIIQEKKKIHTLFTASGHGYDRLFNHKFISTSEEFIEKLVQFKQPSFWPYDSLTDNSLKLFLDKLYIWFTKKIILKELYYVDKNQFLEKVSQYIHQLFNEVVEPHQTHVLLNNTFEPYNPSMCLNMVENSYSIIVDRDPRDIFASLINSNAAFIPSFEKYKHNDEIKKKMVGFDNIEQFIARYHILKNNVNPENHSAILRIRYEDFILNHAEVSNQILNHVGITNLNKHKQTAFNVQKSMKNIGIWKKYSHLPEIIKIEKELAEYCYQT